MSITGDCFPAAIHAGIELANDGTDPETIVVAHGHAYGQGGNAAGLIYDHAWIEVTMRVSPDGLPPELARLAAYELVTVIDKSNGLDVHLPRELYYKLGRIEHDEVTRYRLPVAIELANTIGTYGPWEDQ